MKIIWDFLVSQVFSFLFHFFPRFYLALVRILSLWFVSWYVIVNISLGALGSALRILYF